MLNYRRIGLTVKSDLDRRDQAARQIIEILQKEGADVCVDAQRAVDVPASKGLPTFTCDDRLDLLVILGGDGTILRSVRELRNFSIPLLSINRGTVGFLAETNMDEAPSLIPELLHGKGRIEERSVLHVVAKRGKKELFNGFVLNEAVLSQGSIARLVDLRTTVHGEELTTFRADGLIIATPTGSTAYTLAAGGPIVHPSLAATILTPINPHSFSQKPIVIPGGHAVEVEVLKKLNKFGDIDVSLTLDGQSYVTLERNDRVQAKINGETVKFLRRKQESFYGTLREKLKWGETMDAN